MKNLFFNVVIGFFIIITVFFIWALFEFSGTALLLSYIGLGVHQLIKIGERKNIKDFSFIDYFENTKWEIMVTIYLILSLHVVIPDIVEMTRIVAFIIGYQTDSIFKSFIKIYSSKLIEDKNKL
jgi:hypothetical protein